MSSVIIPHNTVLNNEKVITNSLFNNEKVIQKTFNIYLKSLERKNDFEYIYNSVNRIRPDIKKYFSSKNFFKDLKDCGSWLEFRDYYNKDVIKLHHGNFCKRDKLCPACAVRRAYKQQQKFIQCAGTLFDNDWYYIVLPVIHNRDESFLTVFNRVTKLLNVITKSMRDKKSNNFFSSFLGGMSSIETTKSKNGWNVHLNLLINSPKGFKIDFKEIINKKGQVSCQNNELVQFLQKYADNSKMHNISKIDFTQEDEIKKNLVEVLKYSLKFSSLSSIDLIEVYMNTYKKPLFRTFGNLRGVKLEDVQLECDDIIDDEFIELIYRRTLNCFGSVDYILHSSQIIERS